MGKHFPGVVLAALMFVLPVRAAEEAPIRLISGGSWKLPDERGRQVVLAFFADFCKPCEAEVPHLKALKKEFGESVAVIGVAHPDSKSESPAATAKRYGIDYPVLEDTDGALTKSYKVGRLLPTTVVLGETGDELKKARGMTPEILSELRRLLGDGQTRLRGFAAALTGEPSGLIRVSGVAGPPGLRSSAELAAALEGPLRAAFTGGEGSPLMLRVTATALGSSKRAGWVLEDHLGRMWFEGTEVLNGTDAAPLIERVKTAAAEIRGKALRGAGGTGQ